MQTRQAEQKKKKTLLVSHSEMNGERKAALNTLESQPVITAIILMASTV